MVVAKLTSKNQLTLPKAVLEQAGRARALEGAGITEADVADAVAWARQA